jgi:hypothetical protein
MTIQDLGSIGEFISSLIVLVTLIYLARQVRQANNAMRLAAVQSQRAETQANFRAVRDSPFMPAILVKAARGEELNAEEQHRMGSHISLHWSAIYSTWVQGQLSGADPLLAGTDVQIAIAMRGFGGRAVSWWNAVGRLIYPEPFIAFVDEKMETMDNSLVEDVGRAISR